MSLEEEVAHLRAENAALRAENEKLSAQLTAAHAQILDLHERLAQTELALRAQTAAAPAFVKPAVPARERRPRRKRAPQHNHGRRREPPTRIVPHALDECPTCGYHLRGRSVAHRRQVIDLPPPQPVEVTEHQVLKRWCPHCEHWVVPKQVVAGLVVGQGRLGVRVCALIVYLACLLRLPVRLVQRYLATLHHLQISSGEIAAVLQRVATALQAEIAQLKQQARASPVLHGDETGWRQGGQNGYIWAFSTPAGAGPASVRYYEYDPGHGQEQVKRLLGGFKGLLVSDFLAAYNIYTGPQQRCWVHLLRALHELKEKHGTDAAVVAWGKELRALYDEGQAFVQRAVAPSPAEREAEYVRLVERAHRLGLQYAEAKKYKQHPCYALCKRVLRHELELFQFVLVAGVPADNNQAERAIRPLVVIRKISGGSRSAAGTTSRLGLFSLLETWRARGLDPLAELVKRLSQPALEAPAGSRAPA